MVSVRLDDLNPEQRAAVVAPDGPILILAGAGSGKTRVLTYRIAHLLAERTASVNEMLAVTFTNKAANEMRERVASIVADGGRIPWVSTFHSACARILRQEGHALGYERNFTILDESDSMTAMRRVLEDAALADSPPPELVRSRIEQAKNEAVSPEAMLASAEQGRETTIANLYRLYQERLKAMNAMDFSDLQLQTYLLFEQFPEVLARWQPRAKHLLVDEFQDTNRVQYLVVKALAERSGNLCVVGDEDQSIYRWRGADIRNILDFERDYPTAQTFKLEQNYRSTKTILAAAGGVRFYEQRDIKDLLAYLRVIANPADALSLERMLGVPPRGIGAKSFEAITEIAAHEQISAFEAMGRLETYSKVALRIAKQAGMLYGWMRDLMVRAPDLSVRAILDEVVTRSRFEAYLDTLADAPTRKQNLAEMLAAANAFDAEHSGGGLLEFLERVALVSDTEQIDSSGG